MLPPVCVFVMVLVAEVELACSFPPRYPPDPQEVHLPFVLLTFLRQVVN